MVVICEKSQIQFIDPLWPLSAESTVLREKFRENACSIHYFDVYVPYLMYVPYFNHNITICLGEGKMLHSVVTTLSYRSSILTSYLIYLA